MRNRRSIFKPKARGSYKVEAKGKEATVYIYDEISWWAVDANQFVKDFAKLDVDTIHLRVNSPGGSVFDGLAIYNAIKRHDAKVIAHVDALAASIASIIVLAADEVRAAKNSFYMIHDPYSIVVGSAADMREEADLLDKVAGTLIQSYADKSGMEPEEIADMMAKETWFTAQEALDSGFIDFIDEDEEKDANANAFDLSVFANTPETLLNESKQPPANERDLEKVLRDVGYSRQQAKTIVSEGFKALQRDDAEPTPRDVEEPKDQVAEPVVDPVQDPPPPEEEETIVYPDRMAELLTKCEMIVPST
jgi:ATP-dependent Clp protease protease subunit